MEIRLVIDVVGLVIVEVVVVDSEVDEATVLRPLDSIGLEEIHLPRFGVRTVEKAEVVVVGGMRREVTASEEEVVVAVVMAAGVATEEGIEGVTARLRLVQEAMIGEVGVAEKEEAVVVDTVVEDVAAEGDTVVVEAQEDMEGDEEEHQRREGILNLALDEGDKDYDSCILQSLLQSVVPVRITYLPIDISRFYLRLHLHSWASLSGFIWEGTCLLDG